MKKLLSLSLALLLASCASSPEGMITESQTEGMTKIAYEIQVDAPKSEVWAMLEDFDNLSWSQTVTGAHYLNSKRSEVGMSRHCDLADGGYIVETITNWNQGNGFTYQLNDASDPLDPSSYAIWKVRGNSKKSVLSFEVHYELKYGIIGDMMNGLFAKDKFANSIVGFMNEFKQKAERTN